MRKYATYTAFILAIYGGAVFSAASPPPVSIDLQASIASPTIGDSLTVICTVSAPDSVLVGAPYPSTAPDFVDMESQWHRRETTVAGLTIDRYGYLAYVLSPDTLTVGPFMVNYEVAGVDSGTAVSNILTIVVDGVIEIPDADIPPEPKPDRTPFRIEKRGIPAWAYLLTVIVVAAVAAYMFYRKNRRIPEEPVMQPVVIDDIDEFEKIRRLDLPGKGEYRLLYTYVSDTLRSFLHRTMSFDAIYETSEEILTNLSKGSVDNDTYNRLRDVMYEADMVKFAKYSPDFDRASSLIDRTLVPVKTILAAIEREKERLAVLAAEGGQNGVADGGDSGSPDTAVSTGKPGGES
jgi:hypothetical protein